MGERKFRCVVRKKEEIRKYAVTSLVVSIQQKDVINPRCACAARVTVVVLCVCVCVCVCLSHRNLKNDCVKHRTEPHFEN